MADRTFSRRRRFLRDVLGSASALALAGCDRLSGTDWFPKLLGSAERLSNGAALQMTN